MCGGWGTGRCWPCWRLKDIRAQTGLALRTSGPYHAHIAPQASLPFSQSNLLYISPHWSSFPSLPRLLVTSSMLTHPSWTAEPQTGHNSQSTSQTEQKRIATPVLLAQSCSIKWAQRCCLPFLLQPTAIQIIPAHGGLCCLFVFTGATSCILETGGGGGGNHPETLETGRERAEVDPKFLSTL